jgi:hypothetical protein
MINVLFIDRNDPHTIQWIRGFSEYVNPLEIKVFCISDREPSFKNDALEIINISDIPQQLTIDELQNKFDFSVHKTLVTERSFFDYSSFRTNQCYSKLSLCEIESKILPYLNAYDYVIREKVELIIDSLADNFLTSICEEIAEHYNVRMIEKMLYYWWSDGFLPIDKSDQTSSIIDENYRRYYSCPDEIDHNLIRETFESQTISWQYDKPSYVKVLLNRIAIVKNRNKSYEPISIKNWVQRRGSRAVSKLLYAIRVKKHHAPVVGEKYIYFPLHVAPEAVLLGSAPEFADQFSLIKNISMNLPWGVKLYVKDHPAQQIGLMLNYDFYKKLLTLPNVRYFPPSVRSESLIEPQECLAVAVINGTVGLEAAMKQKPVYVFGNAVYKAADCFIKPLSYKEFSSHFLKVVKGEFKFNQKALDSMLMALISSVYRCSVDFGQIKTWQESSFASYPMHNDYIKSQLWRGSDALKPVFLPEDKKPKVEC